MYRPALIAALALSQFLGDLLYFSPDAKQIAAPQLSDLFFGVAAPNQFQRDVECFRRAVPAVDSAAAIEVRRNSNVIDSNELHRAKELIKEMQLDVRYKDVTFETLKRQDFLDAIKEAFPRIDWDKPYKEFRAAGEKEE